MNVEPSLGAALVVADLAAYAVGKDLGATAREGVEARLHQLAKHLLVSLPVQIGEKCDLDGGEALQVDGRLDLLEPAKQLKVVIKGQVGVQPIDNMHFRQGLVGAGPQLVPRLLQRHGVRLRVARLETRKRAEQTARDTYIRCLEPNVVIEERLRPVPALALSVR